MQKKSQAEFALILGLLIIAIVVGIFAYSSVVPPSLQPTALSEEQHAVDTYVKDAIRRASSQALTAMYNQGGYVDTTGKRSVEYGGGTIPYWQLCDTADIPDVERNFELGIKDMLKSSLPDRTDIAGKRVSFDKSPLSVDAQLFENSITLSVNVPTTVEGQAMPQPYTIVLQNRLGRISEFAKNFASFQAKYRALDHNLLRLIPRSNPKSEPGSCWLPTKGVQFKGSFSKGWQELRDCMQELIIHNLVHTYEWEKPVLRGNTLPKNMLGESWIFEIVKSDGTWGQYKELDVEFYYGGGDEKLSRSNSELLFGTSPDPVHEKGDTFSMIGYSIGPVLAYDVKYHVSYPVVVSVWDPLLERSFKFTTFVNIKGSQISNDCKLEAIEPSEYQQKCILGATEDMHLTVLDHNGQPLENVDVWYDGCGPWRVFGGDLRTRIPQATNAELMLLHDLGSNYTFCIDSDDLRENTIRFPVMKGFDVNFYVVKIEKSPYRIKSVEKTLTENITVIFTREGNPCMGSTQSGVANYDRGWIEQTDWIDIYPTVEYDVVILAGKGIIETEDFVIDEGSGSLNIYAPSVHGYTGDTESIKSLYSNCGMSPVSTEFYGSKAGCSL